MQFLVPPAAASSHPASGKHLLRWRSFVRWILLCLLGNEAQNEYWTAGQVGVNICVWQQVIHHVVKQGKCPSVIWSGCLLSFLTRPWSLFVWPLNDCPCHYIWWVFFLVSNERGNTMDWGWLETGLWKRRALWLTLLFFTVISDVLLILSLWLDKIIFVLNYGKQRERERERRRWGWRQDEGERRLCVRCHGCCTDKVTVDVTGKCHHVSS